MTMSVKFIFIFVTFAIFSAEFIFGQRSGIGLADKDKDKAPPPVWAPSFPGFGSRPGDRNGGREPDWRENEVGVDPVDEVEYNENYPPLIPSTPKPRHRTSTPNIYDAEDGEDWRGPGRRTSTPRYIPPTTTRYYPPTSSTALPWYKRFGNYAKDKFNTVYHKISG